MKLCVFGAGAVGGHIAAKLAASGEDVSVIARGEHLDAVKRNGLKLLHGDEVIVGKAKASDRPADLGPQDLVLVTLKANLLGAFAESAAPLLGPETAVVFVQNGIPWWYAKDLARLDPGGKLARAISPQRVIGGVAYSANTIVEPGVIKNYVPGNNMIVVGEADVSSSQRIVTLREILEKAGMASPPVEDIRQAIWAKLLQNLGTSSLTTLTGAAVDEVRGDPHLSKVMVRLGAEGKAIAKADGVDVERAPARPSGGQSSGAVGHKPSMLQDYERGRPMEIDAQLTAPLEIARARGIAAPTLEAIVALVLYKATAKGLYP
ncbi:MAG TPA: ketopantoate reductase family protein [Burkholderiales bacterium]